MVTIKRGTVEDVDSLLSLSKNLFDEIGHQFPISDDNRAKAFCQDLLKDEHYVVFIASDAENSACGIITLSGGLSVYAGGTFGIIREFYVIEQKRSSGIGKALLHRAIEFARSKGWNRLEVTPPHKREIWGQIFTACCSKSIKNMNYTGLKAIGSFPQSIMNEYRKEESTSVMF